ncbi:MAG: hypothetical protein JO128_17845 [Alphaproteobacteria bacterium]|nr:hypothetical protein [Alphaproteobacteria bacterium]
MIFNMFLANHPPDRLKKLHDLVRPIEHGLIENGHHVIGYGLGLLPAPAVNLLVEFFPDDSFVDELLRLKADAGAGLRLGLIGADDVEDDEEIDAALYPRRRANVERVLARVDFAWTVPPLLPFYESFCGRGNAATIAFGFSERLLNRRIIARPELRDLDVLIEGEDSPRCRAIADDLTARGLKCYLHGPVPLPSFATADLARRAKLVLDARRGAHSRFSSAPRICKGLHSGALLMTERGRGAPGALDRFAVGCDPGKTVEDCVAAIESKKSVDLGLAALEKFRVETSMRHGLRDALGLSRLQRPAT